MGDTGVVSLDDVPVRDLVGPAVEEEHDAGAEDQGKGQQDPDHLLVGLDLLIAHELGPE